MLVLVTSKHKAYRSISCYPHTHTHTHVPVRDVTSICCVFVTVSLCSWLLDQRNWLVFALIVRQLVELYRLLKHPHWNGSANGHWMTFPPTTL